MDYSSPLNWPLARVCFRAGLELAAGVCGRLARLRPQPAVWAASGERRLRATLAATTRPAGQLEPANPAAGSIVCGPWFIEASEAQLGRRVGRGRRRSQVSARPAELIKIWADLWREFGRLGAKLVESSCEFASCELRAASGERRELWEARRARCEKLASSGASVQCESGPSIGLSGQNNGRGGAAGRQEGHIIAPHCCAANSLQSSVWNMRT